jgi:glutaredoxin
MLKQIALGIILATISLSSFAGYHKGDKVVLVTSPNCPACETSKKELRANNIPFVIKSYKDPQYKAMFVPQLYVNGKYKGTGSEAVHRWIIS